MRFEWDETKNDSNVRKHGVDFVLAEEVFRDPLARIWLDRFIDNEERWIAMGMARNRLLIVVFTLRDTADEEVIRIISARSPNRSEREHFERGA